MNIQKIIAGLRVLTHKDGITQDELDVIYAAIKELSK